MSGQVLKCKGRLLIVIKITLIIIFSCFHEQNITMASQFVMVTKKQRMRRHQGGNFFLFGTILNLFLGKNSKL